MAGYDTQREGYLEKAEQVDMSFCNTLKNDKKTIEENQVRPKK